jgi:fructosamine-3-kinase
MDKLLLDKLRTIEPDATFELRLPRVHSSSGAVYFAKIGAPSEAEQYIGEANSLNAINEAAPRIAPRVLVSGVTEAGVPYFISEYKDISSLYSNSKAANELAKRMATEMHAQPNPDGFGFPVPTYCGPTRLQNGMFKTWHECYGSQIGDLLHQLHRQGCYPHLCKKGEIVKNE